MEQFTRYIPLNKDRQTKWGKVQFSLEERERIKSLLQQKLGPQDTKTRPGPNNSELTYLESGKAIELANETFGPDHWACEIVDITPDFIEETEKQTFRCGVTAVVRVSLKDGTFHEDVGFGCAENKSRAIAIENSKKEAVTDARKRAFRLFGNKLGNCLYDAEHRKRMKGEGKSETKAPAVPSQNPNTAQGMPPQNYQQPAIKQEPGKAAPPPQQNRPYQPPQQPQQTTPSPPKPNQQQTPSPPKPYQQPQQPQQQQQQQQFQQQPPQQLQQQRPPAYNGNANQRPGPGPSYYPNNTAQKQPPLAPQNQVQQFAQPPAQQNAFRPPHSSNSPPQHQAPTYQRPHWNDNVQHQIKQEQLQDLFDSTAPEDFDDFVPESEQHGVVRKQPPSYPNETGLTPPDKKRRAVAVEGMV
eukprot:TRINITY_DN7876_c0_g1_i2.p1 TRINITY_DN7876_c0_g1~~TRINITY_DN7876_c0_g1_i2.p1  ORF type:complete len:412 (+),score=94.16 TRINITY_DN7876_c0_g1_i2:205-1440(+)